MLELNNLKVHYGGVKALDGVDVELFPGEIVALMGPNGAGKSTILKALFGIAPLTEGAVKLDGRFLKDIAPHRMVEAGICFVPQGRRVFANLSVEENLEIGGYIVSDSKERKRRMESIMDIFPILKSKRKDPSRSLSGGQQQLLAIARGLMAEPRILLLDEPTLGLSPKMVKEVFEHIKYINQERQTSIVVVEHNIKSLLAIANRAYVLNRGKVAYQGSPKELTDSGVLEKVFMGTI